MWLAVVCRWPKKSANPVGWNSFETMPASYCAGVNVPPTEPSNKVPLVKISTAPLDQVWPRPAELLTAAYSFMLTKSPRRPVPPKPSVRISSVSPPLRAFIPSRVSFCTLARFAWSSATRFWAYSSE
jgi:hypothetical protein